MGDLTERMRISTGALLIAFSVIGFSLWALNTDMVEQLSLNVFSPIPIMATLERNTAITSLEKHLFYSKRSEVRSRRNSVALQSILNKNLRLSGSETLDEREALRRRAAVALLVFASVESSRGASH